MRSRFHKRTKHSSIKIEPVFIIKLVLIVCLYFIIFTSLSNIINRSLAMHEFENDINEFAIKNGDTVFEINELTLYSSANARTNTQSVNLGLDISQYTDISFYISNPKGKIIKSLKISEIAFNPTPEIRNTCNIVQESIGFWKTN